MARRRIACLLAVVAVLLVAWATLTATNEDGEKSTEEEASPGETANVEGEPGGEDGSPVLLGTASAREAGPGRRSATDERDPNRVPAESAWPPELPIPQDKGSVAGTILFEDGSPLVGVRVALWGSPNVAVATDTQGRYHVHADWLYERALYIRLGSEDQPAWLGFIVSRRIAMKAGELVMQDVTLERGMELVGFVTDEGTGLPLVGAKVTLRRKPHHDGQGAAGFLFTDEQGRFRFPYVPRSTCTLQLQHVGYEACIRELDLSKAPFPTRWTMCRARQLVLRLAALPEGAVGTEVRCDLTRRDGAGVSVTSTRSIQRDGTIVLDAPVPALYRLTLYKSSHLPRLEVEVEITAETLDPVVIGLKPGVRVEGTISDAAGAPVVDAKVTIPGAAGSPVTDAEGAFSFPSVPPGVRDVRIHVGSAWTLLGTVDVPEDGSRSVNFRVLGTAVLEGALHVGGERVRPQRGEVRVRDAMTLVLVATARPNVAGRFLIPMLRGGTYELVAWCMNGIPATREIALGMSENRDLGAIDLDPYLRLPVHLVLPVDCPKDTRIHVWSKDPSHPENAQGLTSIEVGGERWTLPIRLETDGDKRTWVTGLTPGRHRLDFQGEGLQPASVEVDVRPGLSEPVMVRFEAAVGD